MRQSLSDGAKLDTTSINRNLILETHAVALELTKVAAERNGDKEETSGGFNLPITPNLPTGGALLATAGEFHFQICNGC